MRRFGILLASAALGAAVAASGPALAFGHGGGFGGDFADEKAMEISKKFERV